MSIVVQELRRTRRVRRLGDLEWFEIAYRVYLFALVGGGVVLWLSGLVGDEPATPAEVADVLERGPAVLGLGVAIAVALGLRSGSDGGPVSVEAADVRHLLLAPVPRRDVLARPVWQRLRAVAFGGAIVGAIAGELAARRLPGTGAAWAASGAAAGALTGAAFVAVAVLAHVAKLARWVATGLAAVVLTAQAGAAAGWWPGPADTVGSLALWGTRQDPVDLAGAAVIVAAAVLAVALAGRLRSEPLVRRADLVSQLHFAVTMQDLRTVVLLRRQLRGERARTRPWVRIGGGEAGPTERAPARRAAMGREGAATTVSRVGTGRAVWRRSWRGLLRYPLPRLVRMALLAITAGVATVAVVRGTTPALVGVGVALYLLALDALEPLSQEIDHPDRTDGVPEERGWLLARLLAAPAVALVPFAAIGAAAVTALEPDAVVFAFGLCVPLTLAGACGAIVSVVRDAPDPLSPPVATSAAVPPEFAGFTTTLRLLWPLAVSTLTGLAVLAVREQPTLGTAARVAVAAVLVTAATVLWVRRRDAWRVRIRAFLDEGRAAAGMKA